VMCQDESVELVKELMAELRRHQSELVERLNEIQQRIEGEKDGHRKFLLRVEWMEEKQHSVVLLNKVLSETPFHSFRREHP